MTNDCTELHSWGKSTNQAKIIGHLKTFVYVDVPAVAVCVLSLHSGSGLPLLFALFVSGVEQHNRVPGLLHLWCRSSSPGKGLLVTPTD